MADFVSFNEFLDRTGTAKAEQHFTTLQAQHQFAVPEAKGMAAALPKDEFEAEFDKMKEYLLRRYDGVRCEHTFLDSNGNFVDCVPFEQQPTVRTALAAGLSVTHQPQEPPSRQARPQTDPMKLPPVPTPIVAPLRRGLLDPFGQPIGCPEGLVPLRRVTVSQMARYGKFEDFFQKMQGQPTAPAAGKGKRKTAAKTSKAPAKKKTSGQKRPVPPAAAGHRYAVCQDTHGGPYYGCATGLNLWKPRPYPGVFSLSQLWIVGNKMGGPPNFLPETIESGWIVYPTYPSGGLGNDPVLFVFFNPDGYVQGGNSGYVENQHFHGFIRFNSGWVLMSGGLPNLSTPGAATQTGLQMLWALQDGNNPPHSRGWYLYIGQDSQHWDNVGYFPAALYQNGILAQSAKVIQFGGEVAAGQGGTGQMGSGALPRQNPADSYGAVAFQYEMYVQTQVDQEMVEASLQLYHADRPYYDVGLSNDPTWSSYFFFGGAGAP
jgi:hypothetical protein